MSNDKMREIFGRANRLAVALKGSPREQARAVRELVKKVLRSQASFLAGLSFNTRWARQLFPQKLIHAKTEEAEQLLRLLETAPACAAGD